jgi:hypothetical protein
MSSSSSDEYFIRFETIDMMNGLERSALLRNKFMPPDYSCDLKEWTEYTIKRLAMMINVTPEIIQSAIACPNWSWKYDTYFGNDYDFHHDSNKCNVCEDNFGMSERHPHQMLFILVLRILNEAIEKYINPIPVNKIPNDIASCDELEFLFESFNTMNQIEIDALIEYGFFPLNPDSRVLDDWFQDSVDKLAKKLNTTNEEMRIIACGGHCIGANWSWRYKNYFGGDYNLLDDWSGKMFCDIFEEDSNNYLNSKMMHMMFETTIKDGEHVCSVCIRDYREDGHMPHENLFVIILRVLNEYYEKKAGMDMNFDS